MRKNNRKGNRNFARAISASMAAISLMTAAQFIGAVPVYAAEADDEYYMDDYDDYEDDGWYGHEHCDDYEGGYSYDIYYDADAEDEVIVVEPASPEIYNSNYYPGDYVCNHAPYPVTLCFKGSNGQTYVQTLEGGGSFLVQRDFGSGIATKDWWNCSGAETQSYYTFTANTPDVPQKQEEKKQEKKQEQSQHVCNMEWVTVKEATKTSDGLEQYRCKDCGRVEMEVPINAATTYIKELYSAIDKAPANGTVVYNAENYYTISKYVLQKMAQRNDVTVAIQFNYKNVPYTIVFPAKTDYTKLLQSKDQFFGFMGLNGYNGIAVAKR